MLASNDEEAIRSTIDEFRRVMRDKDARALSRLYTEDVVFFDLAPPLKHTGFHQKWVQEWFDDWDGGIGFEPTDVVIDASSDLAIVRSIDHMTGKKKGGETVDLWSRSTVCFRKAGGAWKVFHVHSSVPFYMDGSFKAAVDLKPE